MEDDSVPERFGEFDGWESHYKLEVMVGKGELGIHAAQVLARLSGCTLLESKGFWADGDGAIHFDKEAGVIIFCTTSDTQVDFVSQSLALMANFLESEECVYCGLTRKDG